MAEGTLNIYQKLAKIRKIAEVLQKNKEGHGYKYVSEDEILLKVTSGMEKYGLSLIPRMIQGTDSLTRNTFIKVKEFADKTGNIVRTENTADDFVFKCWMEWQWINDENPSEFVSIPWMIVGQQTNASMSFGSGLTYTTRYFLLKYFNVATSEDDPDNYKERKSELDKEEEKKVVAVVLSQIEKLVDERVNETNKAAVKKAILDAKLILENGKPSNKFTLIKDLETAQTYLKILNSALGIKTDDGNKEE